MLFRNILRTVCVITALVVVLPATGWAGSYGFYPVDTSTAWRPQCAKPSAPLFSISTMSDYTSAAEEYNTYVSSVEAYLKQIEAEAKKDVDQFVQSVNEGSSKAQEEILQELEYARKELEAAKKKLPLL